LKHFIPAKFEAEKLTQMTTDKNNAQ